MAECNLRHPTDCTCDDGMFEANNVGYLVVVHWEDTTNVADWQDRQEIQDFATNGAWICENVGWVMVDNDDCIVVSSRRAGKIGQFGLTERIPKRNVLHIDRLESVTPVNERRAQTGPASAAQATSSPAGKYQDQPPRVRTEP